MAIVGKVEAQMMAKTNTSSFFQHHNYIFIPFHPHLHSHFPILSLPSSFCYSQHNRHALALLSCSDISNKCPPEALTTALTSNTNSSGARRRRTRSRRSNGVYIWMVKAAAASIEEGEEAEKDAGGRFSPWNSDNAENMKMKMRSRSRSSSRLMRGSPPPASAAYSSDRQRSAGEREYKNQDSRYGSRGDYYRGQSRRTGRNEDYDDNGDDDDVEEDDYVQKEKSDSWLSSLNSDIRAVFRFLGTAFPALLILVPWLFTNPWGFMMALAFLPVASNFLSPILSVQKSLSQLLEYFNSKPKKKRSTVKYKRNGQSYSAREARSSKLSQERDFWMDLQGLDDLAKSMDASNSKENPSVSKSELVSMENMSEEHASTEREAGKRSTFGGWDDLEPIKGEILMPSVRRKESLRRRSRKEQPMFFRILIALFPFLRYWGGFL